MKARVRGYEPEPTGSVPPDGLGKSDHRADRRGRRLLGGPHRPRQPAVSHAHTLAELENAAGTPFDPRVVQAAFAVVADERVTAIPRLDLDYTGHAFPRRCAGSSW